MVLIDVKTALKNYYTNDDGDKLFNIIVDNFENDNPIQVSFKGIDSLNSSFVNSAFIRLLDIYTFNEIREKLSFVDTNKQINLLILGRFKFEVKKKAEIKEMVLA